MVKVRLIEHVAGGVPGDVVSMKNEKAVVWASRGFLEILGDEPEKDESVDPGKPSIDGKDPERKSPEDIHQIAAEHGLVTVKGEDYARLQAEAGLTASGERGASQAALTETKSPSDHPAEIRVTDDHKAPAGEKPIDTPVAAEPHKLASGEKVIAENVTTGATTESVKKGRLSKADEAKAEAAQLKARNEFEAGG